MKKKKLSSRREFLRSIGHAVPGVTAAATVAAGCTSKRLQGSGNSYRSPTSNEEKYDCIVIGAGVSGLTAAKYLTQPHDAQIPAKRVLILEGSLNVGGRVCTTPPALEPGQIGYGRRIELGAEFIHIDPKTAPLWNEVLQYKLKTWKFSKADTGYVYYSQKSGAISLYEAGRNNLWHSIGMVSSLRTEPTQPDLSAATFLSERVEPKGSRFALDMKRMILTGHMGANEKQLSMRGFQSDKIREQISYTNDFYVQQGYDWLPHSLAKNQNIQYGQVVESITYPFDALAQSRNSNRNFKLPRSRQQVIVKTQKKSYSARSVILTTSVGVIKSGRIKFNPALPADKQVALDSLCMSSHAKVILQFKKPFWPRGMRMYHRPAESRELAKTYFVPLAYSPEAAPVIIAYVTGTDCQAMDALPRDEVIRRMCLDLQAGFPQNGDVQKLVAQDSSGTPLCLIKKWNREPLFLGGFAFIEFGHRAIRPEDVRRTYADPRFTPGLFWGGEAAATFTQPACVHGAHSAGIRAALEVHHFLDFDGEIIDSRLLEEQYFSFNNQGTDAAINKAGLIQTAPVY